MKPRQRYDVIVSYLTDTSPHVDILDADFVDHYIERANPSVIHHMAYGAHKVPQLGRDLSNMCKVGILDRVSLGVPFGEWGMPRWVWSYSLKKEVKNEVS